MERTVCHSSEADLGTWNGGGCRLISGALMRAERSAGMFGQDCRVRRLAAETEAGVAFLTEARRSLRAEDGWLVSSGK